MKTIHAILLLTTALTLAAINPVQAETLYVPNADFGLPGVTNFDTDVATNMIDWGTFPPYPYDQGAIGVFANLPEDGEYIVNCDGPQAAYIFNDTGLAMFQDYTTVDSTGVASNNFTATYDVGRCYHLKAGVIGGALFGELDGASLQMSLYYLDASNNMVTVAATNIVVTDGLFPNDTNFVTFEIDSPPVQAGDAWAGRHIGIQFLSTTSDTNNEGGFWDVGNIQLHSSIYVPNADFGLPLVTNDEDVATNMIDWGTFPPYPYNQGAIGVFGNQPDDGEYIVNCDGPQAAYIFNDDGLSLFQDYTTVDSTGVASNNFTATYEIGKSYRLKAGIIGNTNFGEPPGASMLMSLYYLDASNNRVAIATTNIVYTADLFPSITNFVTIELKTPMALATQPWAGQHIGIEFAPNSAVDLQGGYWDVGNIELSEWTRPMFTNTAAANGQFIATVLSEPGAVVQILATTNLSPANWTNVVTLTNLSGNTTFIDSTTGGAAKFYVAGQSP